MVWWQLPKTDESADCLVPFFDAARCHRMPQFFRRGGRKSNVAEFMWEKGS